MKKGRWLLPVLAAAVVCCGQGSYAFFTASDVAENRMTPGYNDTEIEEEFPDPTPVPVDEDPEYTKKVWVTNRGDGQGNALVDCYVRVMVSYSDSAIGKAVTLKGLNTADWTYEDGYYYYNRILKKNASTTPLFTGFSIDSDRVDDSYKELIDRFEINVYEESVQAEGFASAKDAFAGIRG